MNFSGASRLSSGRFTITGVIRHPGGWAPVTLNWPLLALDVHSLARSWSGSIGGAATGAGRAGNPDLAIALARQAAELEAWLRDPQVPMAS